MDQYPNQVVPAELGNFNSSGVLTPFAGSDCEPRFFEINSPHASQLPPPLFWLGEGPKFSDRVRMHAIGCWAFREMYVGGKGLLFDRAGIAWTHRSIGVTMKALTDRRMWSAASLDPTGQVRLPGGLKVVEVDEPVACLVQPGDTVYGHWLVDLLPRLDFLRQALEGQRIRIVMSEGSVSPRVLPEVEGLLACAGVESGDILRFSPQDSVLLCRHLLVPTYSRSGNHLSPAAARAFDRACAVAKINSDGRACRKVFWSRAGWVNAKRSLVNRSEVESIARSHGFRVVRPETMGLWEKAALLAETETLFGERGSALHLSLFAPRGARVGVLLSERTPGMIFAQSGIGAVLNQPTGYAFGGCADSPDEDTFHVDETELDELLESL